MAIAFDTSSTGNRGTGTSVSWNQTISASNPFAVVVVQGDVTTDVVTGVTIAGVSMTFLDKYHLIGDRWSYGFYLFNPPSGINKTIQINASSSVFLSGMSSSYTGVLSAAIDNSLTNNSTLVTSSVPITNTITSVADNCWHIGLVNSTTGRPVVAGASTTVRTGDNGNDAIGIGDSNGVIHPAGSNSINFLRTAGTGGDTVCFGLTLSPTASSTISTGAAFLLKLV